MDLLLMLVVVLLVFLWISASGRRRAQDRALDRIERRMDLILEHLGVVVPEPDGMPEVDALIRADRKVQAIKRYRELTGEGLVEAKEAVERRETTLG